MSQHGYVANSSNSWPLELFLINSYGFNIFRLFKNLLSRSTKFPLVTFFPSNLLFLQREERRHAYRHPKSLKCLPSS